MEVAGYPKRMRCFWNDCEAWEDWLRPALEPEPDLNELSKQNAAKFQSIDSKLSLALFTMIQSSGEHGADVKARLRQRMQEKGKDNLFTRGKSSLWSLTTSELHPIWRRPLPTTICTS